MHSQGEPATMQRQPTYVSAPLDVFDHLEERILAWVAAGFERRRLLIDPGIGFGKTLAHNVEILSLLGLHLGLGTPIVLGVSRKSFIARLAEEASSSERLPGSLAAALAGRRARGCGDPGARCRRDPTMPADLASLDVLRSAGDEYRPATIPYYHVRPLGRDVARR